MQYISSFFSSPRSNDTKQITESDLYLDSSNGTQLKEDWDDWVDLNANVNSSQIISSNKSEGILHLVENYTQGENHKQIQGKDDIWTLSTVVPPVEDEITAIEKEIKELEQELVETVWKPEVLTENPTESKEDTEKTNLRKNPSSVLQGDAHYSNTKGNSSGKRKNKKKQSQRPQSQRPQSQPLSQPPSQPLSQPQYQPLSQPQSQSQGLFVNNTKQSLNPIPALSKNNTTATPNVAVEKLVHPKISEVPKNKNPSENRSEIDSQQNQNNYQIKSKEPGTKSIGVPSNPWHNQNDIDRLRQKLKVLSEKN